MNDEITRTGESTHFRYEWEDEVCVVMDAPEGRAMKVLIDAPRGSEVLGVVVAHEGEAAFAAIRPFFGVCDADLLRDAKNDLEAAQHQAFNDGFPT